MWWDEETDGELMYPPGSKHPTAEEFIQSQMSNPERVGRPQQLWSDPEFLENLTDLNTQTPAHPVRRLPRPRLGLPRRLQEGPQGQSLDHEGNVIAATSATPSCRPPCAVQEQTAEQEPQAPRPGVPVHLMDIHLEKGMHCVDCHFVQDVHGNTRFQDEVRRLIEIQCIDCHGTVSQARDAAHLGPGVLHVQPGGRPRPGGAAHAVRQAPLRAPRRQDLSRTRWSRRTCAGRSCRRPTRSTPTNEALQRQVGPGQDGALRAPTARWSGATCPKDGETSAPTPTEHELHRLPFVVEPELLRLPSAAEGQHEDCRRCTTRAT